MAKTGTEVLGSRLFNDPRAVEKMLVKVRREASAAWRQLRTARPDADAAHLANLVRGDLAIAPLEIGELQWVKVEIPRRDYLNEYRCWMSAHLAEAFVPYTGSPVFWQVRHLEPFELGYAGKIGPGAVRLRAFLSGKDYAEFEAGVESELDRAREMLASALDAQRLIAEQARCVVEDVIATEGSAAAQGT